MHREEPISTKQLLWMSSGITSEELVQMLGLNKPASTHTSSQPHEYLHNQPVVHNLYTYISVVFDPIFHTYQTIMSAVLGWFSTVSTVPITTTTRYIDRRID